MSIEIIEGCLFEGFKNKEFNVLGHCCNRLNNFGAGIAKEIHKRFPWSYEIDSMWTDSLLLDSTKVRKFQNKYKDVSKIVLSKDLSLCVMGDYGIANIYGQNGFGWKDPFFKEHRKNLQYDMFENSLKQLDHALKQINKDFIIGFPYKIGCDRAGGDWKKVIKIIESELKDFQIKIYRLQN